MKKTNLFTEEEYIYSFDSVHSNKNMSKLNHYQPIPDINEFENECEHESNQNNLFLFEAFQKAFLKNEDNRSLTESSSNLAASFGNSYEQFKNLLAFELSNHNKNVTNLRNLNENLIKMVNFGNTTTNDMFKVPALIQTIDQKELNIGSGPVVLVISLKKQLGKQIYAEVAKYCKAIYFDTGNLKEQILNYRYGIDLIICTASQLLDFINKIDRRQSCISYNQIRRKKSNSFSLNTNHLSSAPSMTYNGRFGYPQFNYSSQQNNDPQINKKQSAPVNMPKTIKRYRKISTDSTGSFSTASSFTSSFSNSISLGSPIHNSNWKKNFNNVTLTNHSFSLQSTDCTLHNSLANLSSSTKIKSLSSLKSDADCLTQMVSSMVNKLKLNDSKCLEDKLANSGNIFHNRQEWLTILNQLPLDKQNGFHIRLEDDGPYGNDDTRCFVLSHFSKLCIREMRCVLCNDGLSIYDRFPLVDGTMFLSPVKYTNRTNCKDINNNNTFSCNNNNESNKRPDNDSKQPLLFVEANIANKQHYIYAICLSCLHSKKNHAIKCKFCNKDWTGGQTLQVGTLYKFEIFSPFPCCQSRLNCSKCSKPIISLESSGGLPYFSSYSEEKECSYCKTVDYHLIKPLEQIFKKNN